MTHPSDPRPVDESPGAEAGEVAGNERAEKQAPPPADAPTTAEIGAAEPNGSRHPRRGWGWLRPWRRCWRSALLASSALGALFLIQASNRRFDFSVPIGTLAVVVAAFAILRILDAFGDTQTTPNEVSAGRLLKPAVWVLASAGLLFVLLRLAVAGVLPLQILVLALLVPALFLVLTRGVFQLGRQLGAFSGSTENEPLSKRYGFWLVAITSVVYLPLLGSFSLSDPWETHYGEVAREMLARDDWISLWWAQDGWFWSKPILNFWIQGLSFSLFGVEFWPDQMIAAVADGRWPQPEWAARLPIFLMALVGVYILYKGVAASSGRRAAFLGSLILITTPYWYFIAHQTMADMPYVAPLIGAMGLMLLALKAKADDQVRTTSIKFGRRAVNVSGFHLLLLVVLISTLPQITYLASRNLTLHLDTPDEKPSYSLIDIAQGKLSPRGFRVHPDELSSGSFGGNCGLPGNQSCRQQAPVKSGGQPALMALIYALALGAILYLTRKERRKKQLFYLGAWYLVALSAMAKGAPGLVLPIVVFAATIIVLGRWRELPRAAPLPGFLVFAVVLLPWYLQMFMRHGSPFIDRLLLHDMYNRAFSHVHDTNEGDDTSFRYYFWQLGYGLFPWNGFLLGGFCWWLQAERKKAPAYDAPVMMLLWCIASFAMFSISGTKFHHYILPLVPPAAMLGGLLLDSYLEQGSPARPGARGIGYFTLLGGGSALILIGLAFVFPGDLMGTVMGKELPPPSYLLGGLALACGTVAVVASPLLFGAPRRAPDARSLPEPRAALLRHGDLMLAGLALLSAIGVGLAGRDLVVSQGGDVAGQARLIQLFTYQYQRPWPEVLEFGAALLAFTIVSVVLYLALTVPRWRRHAAVATSALAVLWAIWGVNVYLVRAAPHWGQRETMIAYYTQRSGPEEPLVAYQMNWKGENFYTGNHVPAFVSSGKKFKEWVKKKQEAGTKVMFFTTEHSRIRSLERELSKPKKFEQITDEALNNKFALLRVEL